MSLRFESPFGFLVLCGKAHTVCLDHHCFTQAEHRGCHLPWSLALADLIGVALALLLVLRDRVRRPALARFFQRRTSSPAKPPPPAASTAAAAPSSAIASSHSRLVDPGTSLDALPKNNSSSSTGSFEPENSSSSSSSSLNFGAEQYSVWVTDPPPDATDPDAWHKYFERHGEVVYVTVARPNRTFLQLLLQRRRTAPRTLRKSK